MKGLSDALRVFGAPAAIGVLTIAGLFAGLVWGEGARLLAWIGVGSPVVVAALAWLRVHLGK